MLKVYDTHKSLGSLKVLHGVLPKTSAGVVTKTKAKPFLKWAGGKTQLLPTLDTYLPKSFRYADDVTYIEPFVGGGAMLFFMLRKYPNIKRAIVNDINPHLIHTYTVIRDEPLLLTEVLKELQSHLRHWVIMIDRKSSTLTLGAVSIDRH